MGFKSRRKKFSEKFENLKATIHRDYLIIIIAITSAIALHMYVKYEKAQKNAAAQQELKSQD